MNRSSCFSRLVSLSVLVCFSAATFSIPALANDEITLRRRLLSGYKYTYGTSVARDVYGSLGLGFQDHFESILATHPPALAKARSALPLNGIVLACHVGLIAVLLLNLKDTLDASSDPFGHYDNDYRLGPIIAIGAVSVVASIISARMLSGGVSIYNENARLSSDISPYDVPETSGSFFAGAGMRSSNGGMSLAVGYRF